MKVKTRTKTRTTSKKKDKFLLLKKKVCRFCRNKVKAIDYKDVKLLETLIMDKGKIFSARSSGNCAKHQRMLAEAAKRARFVSLIPYVR